MTIRGNESLDLLRRLGSGVVPGAPEPNNAPSVGGASFGDLLEQARAGELSSGRTLKVREGLADRLTNEQLERLSRAADAAEASGAVRMLAVVDGLAVTIDVVTRTVEDVASAKDGAVRTGVDAAVVLPESGANEPAAPAILGRVNGNQSLLRLLADIASGSGRAGAN